MAQLKTYYDTLQVSRSANEAVIRAAYRTLAQKYHPDKNPNNIESAHRDTKRLNEAYEVLSNPVRRAAYDETVERREVEIKRHQASNRQRAEPPNNGGRETSDGQASKTGTQHHAAPPRERGQGRSRFENSAADATGANYRSTYAPARKAGNMFTAFIAGFKDGLKPKAAPLHNARTNDEKGQSGKLTFWNVILLCLVGGWILALGISKNIGSGHDKLGFFSLLFNPGFLGMAVVPTAMLGVCAFIGWAIGWMMPATRRHASWVGLMLAVGGFLAIWSGGEIQQKPPVAAAAVTETKSAPSRASVVNDPNAQRLYNATLTEIEARYPVLNPDKPGYRKDLIDQVAKRMDEYAKQGIAKHNALRLAIADTERQTSQARSASTSTHASPVTAPSFSPPARAPAQPTTRELTIDERVTIGMACNDYQMNGDVSGFQSCMRNQTARASVGTPILSMGHLSIDERVTIGMACNDYQMNGDISGFQSCMRAQIAKTIR